MLNEFIKLSKNFYKENLLIKHKNDDVYNYLI